MEQSKQRDTLTATEDPHGCAFRQSFDLEGLDKKPADVVLNGTAWPAPIRAHRDILVSWIDGLKELIEGLGEEGELFLTNLPYT